LRILLAIATKVGLVIENSLRARAADQSVPTDALTGLPNAHSLFLQLDKEIARSQRENRSLAIFIADLDRFGEVNRQVGELLGDKLLQKFAVGLKDSCRSYDYCARVGGDEFVILTPGLGRDGLGGMKRRLDRIASEAGKASCGEASISVTVGEAFYPADGESAEQLLAVADRRLYNAKGIQKARAAAGSATNP
jgi:diguanylate cyclase (GGDEF)-like protein